MEQLEMLLAYQAEDMKADAIDQEMRHSPNRLKLEKNRDFILKQQKLYKQLEQKLAQMKDRKEIIDEALPRYEKQLQALQDRAESDPPANIEAVQALIADLEQCRGNIADFEAELRKLAKDSMEAANRQRSIRRGAATAKQEFDSVKEVYEKELTEQKARLEKQRMVANAKKEGIDPALLETYASIKKHVTPPVSRLFMNQCSGCNTSLPSAVLRKIKEGGLIECETCGRLIVQTEA